MNPPAVILVLVSLLCYTTGLITHGGNKIAVLASGDYTDFGYNFVVNEGRVLMERALNITGSRWVPNIIDQERAFVTMQDLVREGFELIISSTADHGQAAAMAAAVYPNVSFVQNGGTTKLPNLSVLQYNGPDMYYTAGFFSGLMTSNNKVGFVHPGPSEASLATLNSFYVGVKKANPQAEVYVVFTGSYLNPDRTTGACKILINETGVDMIAGQQDDFTLQTLAIKAGLLAVGVTGYPLRDLFGEAIGMSVLRRWDGPLTQYAYDLLFNDSLAKPFQHNIQASFVSGYTLIDSHSYLVPDDKWALVQGEVAFMSNGTNPKPYYCTEYTDPFGQRQPDKKTGILCLQNTTLYTSKMLPGIHNLSYYYVPLVDQPFPNGTRIAVIVLTAILFLFTAIIAGALFILRRDAVILASSPLFMGLVIVGVAMVFSAAIAWVEEPSVESCEARIWLPSLGFTLCMGAMIIKNVRLWIIFDAELKRVRIRDTKLLIWTGVLLCMSVLLLALWTGLGDPHVDIQQGVAGLEKYETRKLCATSKQGDHILYSIIALHASQLLVGCFVTFKIRVIDIEEFNESRPFGLCIYVVSLVLTIAGILIGTGGITNVHQIVVIVAFSLLIGSAAVLFLIFAPKFLTIFVKGERPISRIVRGVTMSNSRSSKGSKNDSGTSGVTMSTWSQSSTDSVPPPSSTSSVAPSGKTIVLTDQV